MTESVIGTDRENYLRKLNRYKATAALLGLSAVVISLLLLLLRTDENHELFLVLSIAVTTLGGWGITALLGIVIKPMKNLFELSCRPTESVRVKIEAISRETKRVERFDCYEVRTEGNIFFLVADGGIKLREGDTAELLVASNIITEVRV